MDDSRKKVSDAQKAAQRRYDQKTKTISVKFTPRDMGELNRLQSYLARTGQSANALIKELIKKHLDAEETSKIQQTKVEAKRDEAKKYYPFCYIEEETLQFMYDNFSEEIVDKLLNDMYKRFDLYLHDDCILTVNENFQDWVEDQIEEMVENGTFDNCSESEILKKLDDSLGSWQFDYF